MTRAFVVAALCALAACGCHRPVETRAEHALTDLLPRFLGKADSYTARVGGRLDAIARGHVRSVHIEGVNVSLLPGVVAERLRVDVQNLSVHPRTGTVQSVGETRFTARFGEGAINAYLARRNLSVAFGRDGKATVTATPELLGVARVPVELRGTVAPDESGTRLLFTPDRAALRVGGRSVGTGLPGFVADHIASRLNPVLDMSGLRVRFVVQSVQITGGTATVSGFVPEGALQAAIANAAPMR